MEGSHGRDFWLRPGDQGLEAVLGTRTLIRLGSVLVLPQCELSALYFLLIVHMLQDRL